MLRYVWKNKIALILLLLSFWLLPSVISLSEQSKTESIVTAIGIDKNNEEYEVSLQYIVPSPSGSSEELKIISQKANTVGSAIEKIKLKLGKLSGFAHCRFLAFNDEAGKQNFTEILDFLVRRKTNTNNIILINTPESAKDLLSMSNKLDSDLYSFLNNNGFSSEFGDFYDLKTIGDYYGSYFSPVKCMFVNSVGLKSANKDSSSKTSSSSGSSEAGEGVNASSSESQTKQEDKEFENKGELLIIKNEKSLLTLTEEESNNLSWFNANIKRDTFSVENYSEGHLNNASILFNVFNKIYKAKSYFKEGKPYFQIDLKLYVRTGEVVAQDLKQQDYEVLQRKYSKKLLESMKNTIISSMQKAEKHFKDNTYDVIDCYNSFYKINSSEFKKINNTLQDKSDFIKQVNFVYNIDFVQAY